MSAAVFPKISIVVPVYNERENLAPLFEKIKKCFIADRFFL